MKDRGPKRVVYLLGAGATHAEIVNLGFLDEKFLSSYGLLLSYVSKRVMSQAQLSRRFKKHVEAVTYRAGPVNIELLISLIASQRIPDADYKVNYLKDLVQKDITKVLTKWRSKFVLHKALFELHKLVQDREHLAAVISLNYDDVLDRAYKSVFGSNPYYCHTSAPGDSLPVLKLHGSFNWTSVRTYGKRKVIPIIPLGINKNYLIPPYNFIWGRALEELSQCDVLRIIGCSLSANDLGLIDLLFKAHLERSALMEIQLIDSQKIGERIKQNYGFFPKLVTMKDIEGSLIPDNVQAVEPEISNPMRIWLRAKALKMLDRAVERTRFLRRIL